MTPQEFKAWFDCFTVAIEGLPNEDQWKRIKARVADIVDDKPISSKADGLRDLEHAQRKASDANGADD